MAVNKENQVPLAGQHVVKGALMVAFLVVACRSAAPDGQRPTPDDAAGPESVLTRGPMTRDAAAAATDTAAVLTGSGGNGGANGSGGASTDPVDAGAPLPEAGPPPTGNGCVPPAESGVCDPVCDTGCPVLSRCDVTDQPHTGRCIGIWLSGEGDLCLKTAISDPCAAHLTCLEGACRRLCYRDSDCASPGTCCGQDLLLEGQPSGYKICTACPR